MAATWRKKIEVAKLKFVKSTSKFIRLQIFNYKSPSTVIKAFFAANDWTSLAAPKLSFPLENPIGSSTYSHSEFYSRKVNNPSMPSDTLQNLSEHLILPPQNVNIQFFTTKGLSSDLQMEIHF